MATVNNYISLNYDQYTSYFDFFCKLKKDTYDIATPIKFRMYFKPAAKKMLIKVTFVELVSKMAISALIELMN